MQLSDHRACRLGIQIGQGVLSQLDGPRPPRIEALMAALVACMEASPTPVLLVLDDHHLIQNEWVRQAVRLLAEHGPSQMHLVLITRSDRARSPLDRRLSG